MGAAAGLLGGWLVDCAVGDPSRRHPVAAFGRLADGLERRCWRDDRLAGAAYAAVLVGGPTAVAWSLERALARRPRARAALLTAALATSMGARSLAAQARGLARTVERGDLAAARARLPALCGRDPAALDPPGLCAAAIESVAENGADAVVAPLWWAALAGTPGVVAHRAANTLDAMVGHRSPRHARFGTVAARLDDGLGWAPARLTATLLATAAPAAGGRTGQACSTWRRDGHRHASPNAGPCEAAMAGALGIRLGGVHAYRAAAPAGQGAPTPAGRARHEALTPLGPPGHGAHTLLGPAGHEAPTPAAPAPHHGDAGSLEPAQARWTASTGPFGNGPAPTPADVDRAVRLMLAAGAAAALICAALAAGRTATVRAAAARATAGRATLARATAGRTPTGVGARRAMALGLSGGRR